ncbi:LicD family-domain-containing protein [Lophiotrema nucula]|uniref:LicD family-domain-containing protein n=1 Tax=Lophiotrema nucula TaxID=690887 RepID=A0A6A5ZKS8_9PLEO|nr:LicD family-domain-containing protein [Lophiotrema nucula]
MRFRLLNLNVVILALSQIAHAIPAPRARDDSFENLRGLTRLQIDRSGKEGDPPDKYFHESVFHPHYDGRFANKVQSYNSRIHALTHLIRTYLSFTHSIGAETWIMHGSLLGWYWNRRIMPWDSDVDVQVSERSIQFLADYYNMTVHTFNVPSFSEEGNGEVDGNGEREGELESRNYMLEINPHWTNPSVEDTLNVIDARWIDLSTGLFIDITTLRRERTAEKEGLQGTMMCKDKHHYKADDVFPLRDSVFEGMPVKVPYAYGSLLEEEYGIDCLTNTLYEGHRFDPEALAWKRVTDHESPRTSPGWYPDRGRKPSRFRQSTKKPGLKDEGHAVPGSSLSF